MLGCGYRRLRSLLRYELYVLSKFFGLAPFPWTGSSLGGFAISYSPRITEIRHFLYPSKLPASRIWAQRVGTDWILRR